MKCTLALERVLDATPHADDFDAVEATFAQNVSVLISAALRSAMGKRNTGFPIDSAFETLRVAACVEATGFLDLGNAPGADEFEEAFLNGTLFIKEVGHQTQDLEDLSTESSFDGSIVSKLRTRSKRNAYCVKALLPTQSSDAPGLR